MNILFAIHLFCFLTTADSQNLVLVGGNLADDNADIYNKIVNLAVSVHFPFSRPLSVYNLALFSVFLCLVKR